MRRAGFPPGDQPGGVAVAPNGGAALLYVRDRSPDVVDRLATWLAEQPWAGALVGGSGDPRALGLLPGDAAGIAGERAPDIALSLRWDSDPGANGFAGRSDATGGVPGQGTHGSGSPHDLRSILVAAGPSFRRGVASDLPSGNIDLAPTILALLGLTTGVPFDGRVLAEAFRDGAPSGPPPRTSLEHVVERRHPDRVLRQRLFAGAGRRDHVRLEPGSSPRADERPARERRPSRAEHSGPSPNRNTTATAPRLSRQPEKCCREFGREHAGRPPDGRAGARRARDAGGSRMVRQREPKRRRMLHE